MSAMQPIRLCRRRKPRVCLPPLPRCARRTTAPTSGLEHRGAENLSAPQLVQDIVGLSERKRSGPGPDSDLRCDVQEIDAVLAREIGNRYQLPFLPEQMVGKARNIAHVNTR